MVNTNFWEQIGGSITLTELESEDPKGMVLLCGPLYWAYKQGGLEGWEKGQGPERVSISVVVDVGGLELPGESGVFERPPLKNETYSDSYWAVSIEVDIGQWESIRRRGQSCDWIPVKGTKSYPGYSGPLDELTWSQALPVRFAIDECTR